MQYNQQSMPEQVLVVDDDPTTVDMVSLHLAAAGYEPIGVDNGLKAMSVVYDRQPRLVICDWLMPKMDGLQVCREVRALQSKCLTYFIMLTIQADKGRLMEAFDAGADDFLCKPFHEGELLARVRAGSRLVRIYDEMNQQAQVLARTNAELCRLNERLQQSSIVDDLTRLFNRRQAMLRLREQWAIAQRYGQSLACAMIDIDHFKRVNDTFGHIRGDAVLQQIGTILLGCVRAADSVYRIGGEEFLIIFPLQNADQATICAERCRQNVSKSVLANEEGTDPITISLGVAQREESMKGPDDLLKAADDALYAAKREGRNRVVVRRLAAA